MKRTAEVSWTLGVLGAALLALSASATPAYAADEATKARCTAYAQRAVQQYQIMKAHPQCEANTDPLNWQDNLDNHYNGCLLLPEKMTQHIEEARENHLQACGALTGNTPGAAPADGSSPASANTGASDGAGASSSAGTAAPGAATSNSGNGAEGSGAPTSLVTPAPGYGGIGCKMPLGDYLTAARISGGGQVTDLKGSVLTFHGSPPVTSQTTAQQVSTIMHSLSQYPLTTAIVARPQYFSTCRGIPAVSALGPWVSAGGPGQAPRLIWVDVGGILSWQEITAAGVKAYLSGTTTTAPTTTAAAKPASPTKH